MNFISEIKYVLVALNFNFFDVPSKQTLSPQHKYGEKEGKKYYEKKELKRISNMFFFWLSNDRSS